MFEINCIYRRKECRWHYPDCQYALVNYHNKINTRHIGISLSQSGFPPMKAVKQKVDSSYSLVSELCK